MNEPIKEKIDCTEISTTLRPMEINNNQEDQGFLPNFCDVNVLFMLILLVELLALILTLASSDVADFWLRLAFISMFTQWLALTNAGLLCLWRNKLNRLPILTNGLICFAIMMSVTLVFSLLVINFGRYLGVYQTLELQWSNYYLLRNLAVSAVVYAVILRYLYIHYQWVHQIKAQGMAQLQALKARIRPHFLFNSMNTIASLITISPAKAEKAVEDLSDLFRASLKEKTVHSLHEEIELTRSYLAIELLRLGDRLQVEWRLDAPDEEVEIPALSLQPLVENAIYKQTDLMLLKIEYQNYESELNAAQSEYRNNLYDLNLICGINDTSLVQLQTADFKLKPDFKNESQFLTSYKLDS
ncbi:MAG: histidine kinase, partial [Gammaproteobacteria bacterium]|nr:histidine kinase [Gammaproteobacteria bacterium]